MNSIYLVLRKIVKWIASLIEDKRGSVSTKRILALWAMWILQKAYEKPGFESSLIWPLIVLIAALVGATLPEWFAKLKTTNDEN